MTLDTYTGLQSAVADWLNRADLSAQIPAFIALAEADMFRRLRVRQMETRATLALDAEYVDLPADWLATIRVDLDGGQPLELAASDEVMTYRARFADATGEPQIYALSGASMHLWPTPDGSYSADLLYFAKPDALSDSVTSNWLLADAPDAYLYGALLQTAPFLQEDARIQTWATLYRTAIDGLQQSSDASRYSGGMRLRARHG